MKLYFIIVFFLLLNGFFIISNNNLYLNNGENIKAFFSLYFGWFENTADNIAELTGRVVDMDWVPLDKAGE